MLANVTWIANEYPHRSNEPGFSETRTGQALQACDMVFLAGFTLEALIRMLALGVVAAPNTYLRNGWNCLDVLLIATGYLSFASNVNLTAVRAARALRPLRTITLVPQLRALVGALVSSLPMLWDVFVLTAFYLTVFGTASQQLFQGTLRGRCAMPDFAHAVTGPDGSLQV
jgi:hypothetical protein